MSSIKNNRRKNSNSLDLTIDYTLCAKLTDTQFTPSELHQNRLDQCQTSSDLQFMIMEGIHDINNGKTRPFAAAIRNLQRRRRQNPS